MGWYDFEDYYEPSEAEIFLDKIKEEFRETLRGDVKAEFERLTKENEELRAAVQEYNNKRSELSAKESLLRRKEENIRMEVEKDFYDKTIIEALEGLMEDAEVWYAEYVPHEQPKCSLCNEERKLIATYPDGKTVSKDCKCASMIYWYEPVISINREVKFHKAFKPRYGSDRKMYFTKCYKPNSNYADEYNYYSEFRIENIFDNFTEDTKKYHKDKPYGVRVAFRNKEACQKYCDWLNEQKQRNNND